MFILYYIDTGCKLNENKYSWMSNPEYPDYEFRIQVHVRYIIYFLNLIYIECSLNESAIWIFTNIFLRLYFLIVLPIVDPFMLLGMLVLNSELSNKILQFSYHFVNRRPLLEISLFGFPVRHMVHAEPSSSPELIMNHYHFRFSSCNKLQINCWYIIACSRYIDVCR